MTPVQPRLPSPSWNDTRRPFRDTATLADLLRDAAREHPGEPALAGPEGVVMSHRKLGEWTDRLAHLLAGQGLGPGTFVALYSDRTPWAVAALVAVAKAGAAYVPIDPAWPRSRAVELMTSLGVGGIIAGHAQLKDVQEFRWEVPSVRAVFCPEIETEETWLAVLNRTDVEDFFNFLSGEADPLEAAGFNLRRSERPYQVADVHGYRDHVAALALEAAGEGADILEIGCGSGLIMEALAPTATRYVVVDPSSVAVKRNMETAALGGFPIEGYPCFAHEVSDVVRGPFDLVLMASTVQFLPDMDYLLRTLDSVLPLLRAGGVILLADLIDPAMEKHAGLRVPPALLRRLPELLPGTIRVEVRPREARLFAGELATRYDAYLFVDPAAPTRDAPRVVTGAQLARCPAHAPTAPITAADIAYVIFTSGSTGTPKGVMVDHRAVVNLIAWMNGTYRVGVTDRVLLVASFCFDLSVYDIFGVLAAGGCVRVATTAELAEPETLIDVLENEPVTIWDSAPAALGMLTPFLHGRAPRGRDRLRMVLLSGDWVPLSMPDEIRQAFPRALVVALGGATECTVWSNHFPVGVVESGWPSVPYGRPMDNARYYVLDENLDVCPVGTDGDLWIAGVCVAVGYVNQPALTAAAFRPDPWLAVPGERMYRTGDRARWLDDGNLEFLGRLDDQVKVRGFRIELGEIRHAIARVPGVRAAIVVATGAMANRSIAAFYLTDPDQVPAVSVAAVLKHLRGTLPIHMMPSRILAVDSFPTSATGKVDREALIAAL